MKVAIFQSTTLMCCYYLRGYLRLHPFISHAVAAYSVGMSSLQDVGIFLVVSPTIIPDRREPSLVDITRVCLCVRVCVCVRHPVAISDL